MVYEHPQFPADLKAEMYAWVRENATEERKPKDTEEQFIYKARKKAIGPFKKRMSGNELGFRLYRKVDAGAYGLYQTLGPNVVSYQDNSVIISHLYTYYVTAFNAVGESVPSNESGVVCGSG